jgi:hypothetical protein
MRQLFTEQIRFYVTLMPDSSQTNTVFTFRTSNANTIGRTKVKMVTEHFDGADNLGPLHHIFLHLYNAR